MTILKPPLHRCILLSLALTVLSSAPSAEARYLGSCVSLLTKSASVSRVENPESGPSTNPEVTLSLAETHAQLERYALQTEVRGAVIEILPDGEPNSNQLARAAYILAHDPVFRSVQFPNGFKLVVDPALQSADGILLLQTGEIRLAASTLADHSLAFATVAHEMSHAEQLSLWLNGRSAIPIVNTVAYGELPGLEKSLYGKRVSAQELPATAVGRHIFEQYKGAPNPEMVKSGQKISKAFLTMANEILSVLDGLSKQKRETLYFTNFRTLRANNQTLMVEYHVGSYSNLKTQKFYASVKVLKRSYEGMREYRLEIPLPGEATSMSAGDFLDLILVQLRSLQGVSQKYTEVFK